MSIAQKTTLFKLMASPTTGVHKHVLWLLPGSMTGTSSLLATDSSCLYDRDLADGPFRVLGCGSSNWSPIWQVDSSAYLLTQCPVSSLMKQLQNRSLTQGSLGPSEFMSNLVFEHSDEHICKLQYNLPWSPITFHHSVSVLVQCLLRGGVLMQPTFSALFVYLRFVWHQYCVCKSW